jgi:hypothetical protein
MSIPLNLRLAIAGKGKFPLPFVVSNRPRGALFYDSFGNLFRAESNIAGGFNDVMKTYFDPTTAGGLQDMSTDGSTLLKSVSTLNHQINNDSGSDPAGWTRGTNYIANLAGITTPANTTDYVIAVSGGINDATVGSPITKVQFKQAMSKLREFIQADFPFVQCGFFAPCPRTNFAASVDANFNVVREAANEYFAEQTWWKRLPDTYDMDMDAVILNHPSALEFQTRYAYRIADCIAATFGKRSFVDVYGPQVTGAVFNGDHMILTVAQDGGTDFATIPALARNTLALRTQLPADFKSSGVTRVNATTLKVDFENIGLTGHTPASAVIAHGTMKELSVTSAEVIKDNATKAKPLRSAVVPIINNHPLWRVTDLNLHQIPKTGAKTYLSGVLATQVTDRMNGYWEALGVTREPTYEDTAFGGRGALVSGDDTTFMMSNTVFTGSNTGWGGVVFEVPAITAANKYLLTFGLGSTGSNLIAFFMNGSGHLFFIENAAGGTSTITATDLRTTKNVLIWNFRSTTEVDFYLNNNAVVTADPRDSLVSFNKISLFNRTSAETGGTVGFKIGEVWHRNSAHVPGVDPSIAEIMAFYQAQYGTQA